MKILGRLLLVLMLATCAGQARAQGFPGGLFSARKTTSFTASQDNPAFTGTLIDVGDSHASQEVTFGTTGTYGFQTIAYQRGVLNWTQALLGYPFKYSFIYQGTAAPVNGNNVGITGEQTKATIARFQHDVCAQHGDVIFINDGTNDVSNNQTQANLDANLMMMARLALGCGAKYVGIFSIMPDSAFSAGQETIREGVNTDMKNYAAQFPNRVHFFDQDPVLYPAGVMDTTLFQTDGVHLNPTGAYKVASQVVVPWWQQNTGLYKVPRAKPSAYSASTAPYGDLVVNGAFTGSGGTAAASWVGSTIPTSWTTARDVGSTVTALATIVSQADWNGDTVNFENVVFTATGAGAAHELMRFAPSASITTGAITGNYYIACEEYRLPSGNASNILEAPILRLTDSTTDASFGSFFDAQAGTTANDPFPTGSPTWLACTQPVRAKGTTGLTLIDYFRIDGTQTGTVTVQFGKPVIYTVLNPEIGNGFEAVRSPAAAATITVTANDGLVNIDSASGVTTVTALVDAMNVGQTITIKDATGHAATNNITIQMKPTGNIDTSSTYVIKQNYGSADIFWDGTNAFVK